MPSELRYCENCGDIIQVRKDESVNVAEQFICENCQGGGSERSSRPVRGREPVELDEESGNLELFSTSTISLHQREFESLAIKHDDAPLKPGGAPAEQEPGAGEDALALAGPDAPSHQHGSTSGGPAPTARRIVFRCMHCRATICIRPIKTTSRLSCPYCSKPIYITQSGQLLAKPPSVVLRQGTGALPEIRPGSVALKKKPDARGAAGAAAKQEEGTRAPSPSKVSERDRSITSAAEEPAEPHPRSLAPPRREAPGDETVPAGGITGFDEDLRKRSPVPAKTKVRSAPGRPRPRPNYARRRTAAHPAPPKPTRAQRPLQHRRPSPATQALDESIAPVGRRPGRRVAPLSVAVPAFGRQLLWGFFITVTVTLPVGLLGVTNKVAGSRSMERASDARPTLFEKVGNIALHGMENLLGSVKR